MVENRADVTTGARGCATAVTRPRTSRSGERAGRRGDSAASPNAATLRRRCRPSRSQRKESTVQTHEIDNRFPTHFETPATPVCPARR